MHHVTGREGELDLWRMRHRSLDVDWQAIVNLQQTRDAAVVAAWRKRIGQLRVKQQELIDAGHWRGGPRTLLAAIDVQYRELAMTAGLAWLLRPDGHHGLGSAVLNGLLAHLEIEGSGTKGGVRVRLEEQRDKTRADLVIYGVDWTILIEAKTFAVEQEDQLDRLYDHWQNEPAPCFVFLTRGEREPTTADSSEGQWDRLTWQQVATIAQAAAGSTAQAAPGVHDYIATLENYHRV